MNKPENGSNNPKGDYRKCQRIERIKYIQQDHGVATSAATVAMDVRAMTLFISITVRDARRHFAAPVHRFVTWRLL